MGISRQAEMVAVDAGWLALPRLLFRLLRIDYAPQRS
jgi:hypothetical protein